MVGGLERRCVVVLLPDLIRRRIFSASFAPSPQREVDGFATDIQRIMQDITVRLDTDFLFRFLDVRLDALVHGDERRWQRERPAMAASVAR